MIKTLKTTINVVSTLLIVAVFILAFLLAGVRLIGYTPYTVLSGSMEPTYHVGSLIYVKEVDAMSLEVDDAITFRLSGGTVVTHKIIEIENANDPYSIRFRTQGEANDTPDGNPVSPSDIIGKPEFSIPYLGYVSNFIQNPPGTYITICLCIIILVLTFMPDLIPAEDKLAVSSERSSDSESSDNENEE